MTQERGSARHAQKSIDIRSFGNREERVQRLRIPGELNVWSFVMSITAENPALPASKMAIAAKVRAYMSSNTISICRKVIWSLFKFQLNDLIFTHDLNTDSNNRIDMTRTNFHTRFNLNNVFSHCA